MSPPAASGSAAAGRPQKPDPSGSGKQPLSCANCRHRKIKCDKTQPRCTQCERSDLDCVFPSRKRNRKPRHGRQSELLSRITRLESIVSKVDSGSLAEGREKAAVAAAGKLKAAAAAAAAAAASAAQSSAGSRGRSGSIGLTESEPSPVAAPGWDQHAPPTNYMSAEFWENLCQEVEGMRQALEQPSDSEESSDDEPSPMSPESSVNKGLTPPALSGLISCGCSMAGEGRMRHPPREHILYMCSIFFANVDPAFKVLHRPTTSAELEAFANAPQPRRIDDATEALFFSMYFGAITSLSNEACLRNLGEERSVLAQRYMEGVERALYKADYLNSTEIKTLQALTCYVCFLRTHNASRATWALIPLVVRLAQALHLHRDGVAPPLPPFEAEMRRRLWWMIVVLDIRAAEDRGTDAAIARQSYNTRLPFNLDDDDFGPSTTTPLEDRTGPTEMTFCLCTSMSSGIFGNLRPRHPQLAIDHDGAPEPTTSEDEIMAHAQRLEALFGTAPSPPPPPSTTTTPASGNDGSSPGDVAEDARHLAANHAAVTVRVIILKLWLSAQYPFTPRAAVAAAKPRVARETMLRTAVNTIELVEFSTSTYRERFGWWIDSYVQWHPLAVALAELCVQTRGELVERAWKVVDRTFFEMGARIADTRRGTLWRPLKKLLRKARAARAEALMGELKIGASGGGGAAGGVAGGGRQAAANVAVAAATPAAVKRGTTPGLGKKEEDEEEEEEEEDVDVDVDVKEDYDVDVEGDYDVEAPESRHQRVPTTVAAPTGVGVGVNAPGGGGGLAATAMMVDAPPNPPVPQQPMEDTAMFGGAPMWGHPQELINHFGLQMDAGDFSWDWSTWNEFVDDANTERSPGDG